MRDVSRIASAYHDSWVWGYHQGGYEMESERESKRSVSEAGLTATEKKSLGFLSIWSCGQIRTSAKCNIFPAQKERPPKNGASFLIFRVLHLIFLTFNQRRALPMYIIPTPGLYYLHVMSSIPFLKLLWRLFHVDSTKIAEVNSRGRRKMKHLGRALSSVSE